MRSTPLSRLAALALVLVAGACSDSTAPVSAPVDLPTALSEMSVSSYIAAGTGVSMSTGAFPASGCSYSASSQGFTCPTLTSNGITVTRGFQLLDANGGSQSAFSQSSTAAIRTTMTVAGTQSVNGDAMTLNHDETMTLSGLLTGNHVLDGTQHSHITGSFSGFALDETMTTTIAGLRPPAQGEKYPRAGTITTVITDAGSSGFGAGTSTMTMVFNGTSKVAITISAAGFSQKCTLDLAATGPGAMSCS